MDLEELQAHALLLFQTVDLIPAIEGGRIEPVFRISPTGDLLHDHGFEDRTLRRSVQVVHEALRERAVRDYDKIANSEERAEDGDDDWMSLELQKAVLAEYGTSWEAFVSLAERCGELAVSRGTGVLELRRSELIAHLKEHEMTAREARSLVDRLTLRPRAGWHDIPEGSKQRDFDLGKLDRPLSPIGRPILATDRNKNPRLLVAPGLIERCILHNLQGAMSGTLQNEFWTSREMRKFVGGRGRLEGNRFNERVAAKLRDLGLVAYPSAKPSWCFNHRNTQELKELGDIDVLAITKDGTRAWIVEAKDLKLCRTLGETARRLAEYEGRTLRSGKPDKMLRHLRRVEYARRHSVDLARRLKLPVVPIVSGVLVVRAPQPMEDTSLHKDPDARVVMMSELGSVPWNSGWP